jgi:hypothetical protein
MSIMAIQPSYPIKKWMPHPNDYQPYDSAGNKYGESKPNGRCHDPDAGEIRAEEFHPAARSAYRWLKGFMVSNNLDYVLYRTALSIAAESGNRQAQICMGTIRRLQRGEPVSDRYLLGLVWSILVIHNHDALEAIADRRVDRAYPLDPTEFDVGEADL